MRISTPILFLSALLFAGCGNDSEAAGKTGDTPPAETGDTTPPADTGDGPVMMAQVHDVICGCAVDAIGHCGNYIIVDGKHLELTGDLGLGDMEFCKKEGLKAEVVGEVVDGKFVATSFEYVQ